MHDPDEGLTTEGIIKTGARRDRIDPVFEPVIDAAQREIERAESHLQVSSASLYIYGSVPTGTAISPSSDIDFLSIGIQPDIVHHIALNLTEQFREICRAVEMTTTSYTDLSSEDDASYGYRVFLRHYCVHLDGRDVVRHEEVFPGDMRAARGLNGDIANHHNRWRGERLTVAPAILGRRISRKLLLAVAGLVSVHDHIWTTDRDSSALRWATLNPRWEPALLKLILWSDSAEAASLMDIEEILAPAGLVSAVVDVFRTKIGLWR